MRHYQTIGRAALVAGWLLCGLARAETPMRIGHYNIRELDIGELNFTTSGQAQAAAEIIQRHQPDILSINEIQYDITGVVASTHTGINNQLFEDNYLSISQNGETPITYPHKYFVQGNSGVASGLGFDYGFGGFEGQYNMAFYSKFPIVTADVRRFQTFLWMDLPGNSKPMDISDDQRLFDKDFWDIPIDVNGQIVHVLMCHAVVPAFEPENPARNFDTLKFISDYIQGLATYATPGGGLGPDDVFLLMGDLNADADSDGDSLPGAIQQITNLDLVNPAFPEGDGLDDNPFPPDNTSYDIFGVNYVRNTFKSGIGNTAAGGFQLQLDYILPSDTLPLVIPGAGEFASRVFWSLLDDPDWLLQRTASDHHFVRMDVVVPGGVTVPGDIDGDGDADAVDRDLFAGALIGTNTDPDQLARSEQNGDGVLNGLDVMGYVTAVLGGP